MSDRGDVEALRVYADQLLEAGNLEGELVQVRLALAAPDELDDDSWVRLTVREAQLLAALPKAPIDVGVWWHRVARERGVVDGIALRAVKWGQLDELIAALARYPWLRRVTLHGETPFDGCARLLEALPSVRALDITDDLESKPRRFVGDPHALVGSPGFARLDELSISLLSKGADAFARALGAQRLPRLQFLSITGSDGDVAADAAGVDLPALERLRLYVEYLDIPRLEAALARRTLSALELWSDELGPGTLELVARRAERLRSLWMHGTFALDEIARFVDLVPTLESLSLFGRCDEDSAGVPAASTGATAIDLTSMSAAAIERLAATIDAPRLRSLGGGNFTPDVLASRWLDGVTTLSLRPNEIPLEEWPRDRPRRATAIRTLRVGVSDGHLDAIVDQLDLSRVRTVGTYFGEPLHQWSVARLLQAVPAAISVELLLTREGLAAMRHAPAPPRLQLLTLSGPVDEAAIESLAEWPGAARLRMLTLQQLETEGAALLVDRRRFPRLEAVVLPDHYLTAVPSVAAQLAARFPLDTKT